MLFGKVLPTNASLWRFFSSNAARTPFLGSALALSLLALTGASPAPEPNSGRNEMAERKESRPTKKRPVAAAKDPFLPPTESVNNSVPEGEKSLQAYMDALAAEREHEPSPAAEERTDLHSSNEPAF